MTEWPSPAIMMGALGDREGNRLDLHKGQKSRQERQMTRKKGSHLLLDRRPAPSEDGLSI